MYITHYPKRFVQAATTRLPQRADTASTSHALKKIVSKAVVRPVFSAPKILSRKCERVNSENPKARANVKTHVTRCAECMENVIYGIPLACGRSTSDIPAAA